MKMKLDLDLLTMHEMSGIQMLMPIENILSNSVE